MKSKLLSMSLALSPAFIAPLAGGGSAEISDLEALIKSNPTFSTFFTQQIELADQGSSTRLGRHFGALGGSRVGPYQFPARFVGDAKDQWPLLIVLHSKWHIADDSGKNHGQDPPPANAQNPHLVEFLERVEIIPNLAPNPTTPIDLANLESRTAEIRKIYAEINAAKLTWTNPKIPFPEEVHGDLKRGTLNGTVRKIVLDFNPSDHGGTNYEAYYDAAGHLAFVYSVSSYWSFINEGQSTIDRTTERRIYFQNGNIVNALEKRYEYQEENQREAASRQAANLPIMVSRQGTNTFHRLLTELISAPDLRIPLLAEEIQAASQDLIR